MKRLLLLAVVFVGITSCVSEHNEWGGENLSSENVGYLSFGESGIQVFVEQEEGEGDVEHRASSSHTPVTRAGVDTSNYTVQILKSDGSQAVREFKLGEFTSLENYRGAGYTNDGRHEGLESGGLELPVGTYTVRVFSAEAENTSDTPEYEGMTSVTLKKGEVTTANVTCSLSSVKVTVTFDSILADVIDPANTRVEASLDEEGVPESERSTFTWSYTDKASLTKSHDNVTATYLKPQNPKKDTGSPMNIYLTTIYGGTDAAGTGSQINAQKLPVGNVKAGEWRKVKIKLDHGTDGMVFFNVTVETWVNNEGIDVTQAVYAVSLGEVEIPDVTDAPIIETPVGGLDLLQALTLSEDMFDATSGAYKGNASMTVKTKQPIKALYLSATSDSEGLPDLISFMGLDAVSTEGSYNGLNLAGTLSAGVKALVNTWGFPTANITSQTEVTFSIAGLLAQLQSEPTYAGSHSFSLTIVDDKENNATYTLQVTSGEEPETSVVWPEKDMSTRYLMTDDLEMVLNIYARGGIKHLWVEIGDEMKTVVESVGIPAKFDLINPGYMILTTKDSEGNDIPDLNDDGSYKYNESSSVGDFLTSLPTPIPIGNDVLGQKKMEFDITGFKSLLGGFSDLTADFKVKVVDSEGGEAEGAILIQTPKLEY